MVDRFDTEKFAELIVREMLQTCEDHPAWTGRMISEQIKQHFGVEL
jgi:transposase